jgi:hypothetical protein
MTEKEINCVDCFSLWRLYLISVGVENKELAGLVTFGRLRSGETFVMAATGELIRLINYVDDINTTLRRIQASLYGMDSDERRRLADSLRGADEKLRELLTQVEKEK